MTDIENGNTPDAIQEQKDSGDQSAGVPLDDGIVGSGDSDSIEEIQKQVEERKRLEAEELAKGDGGSGSGGGDRGGPGDPGGPGGNGRPDVSSKFIRECLSSNEMGDGILYAALHDGKFLYNKTTAEWLAWREHHWERDIMLKSVASVENLSQTYLEEASKIVAEIGVAIEKKDKDLADKLQKTQDGIYKRVGRLRSDRGRSNTLKFAHTNISNPLHIKGDKLDSNPWLFACKNGVLDLRMGRLRPGRPDDLISKASPVEWTGIDTPAPAWDAALKQIFQDHQPLVDYLARMFGYGITGLTTEHFLPILWGQGRNGKGTIIETISFVVGDLAGPIQSEMLLDQGRARSSAGPSPDIMGLMGLRLVFASETDQGRRFSTSKVKWLTGGDTLTGRHPHDKYPTTFLPTHTLILMTNNKPDVGDDDFAFWERVHLIPFELSFVDRQPEKENERPADKNLRENLKKEASGILAWVVRGCLEWQKRGLDPPPKVIEATLEYRANEDLLSHFIREHCYDDPDAETPSTELYDRFRKWWEINVSRKVLSQKKFGGMMIKKYKRSKSGIYRYFGIALHPEDEDERY